MSNKSNNSNKVINGLDTVGHIARDNLERFGSLLDKINTKSGKAKQFKAVDLSNYETGNADNPLSQHTLETSQKLMGGRLSTYSKFAKKVVPNSIYQKATDGAFSQLAKLASTWSQIDLPSEQRLKGVQTLSDSERNSLARDIANQNRALATIGGVTGLAGLPGILADTLWLLLVSLRSIYQLAAVYDQPLTGKQGVKMAYAVLSHADLSKMQEKQTILAALGVAQGLVSNVDNASVREEITKGLDNANANVKFYAEQVDKLAEQFDLDIDNVNLGWLNKLLPVASVATTVHYNSHLIDQVIGVAEATFGPEAVTAKEAITDESDHLDNDINEESAAKVEGEEVNEEVEDQFGEEPTKKDESEAAETEASYDFHEDTAESDIDKKN